MLLFVYYAFLVSLLWAMVLRSEHMLLAPLYYLFGLTVVYAFAELYTRYGRTALIVTVFGVACAVLWEFAYLFLEGGVLGVQRSAGTFNNPNQKGYFGLVAATMAVAGISIFHDRRAKLMLMGVAVLCGVLTVSSLSRAASYAFALLVVILVLRHSLRGALLTAVLLGSVMLTFGQSRLFESRIVNTTDKAGTRGYERLWLYPEHLVLGAGEGEYDRFRTTAIGDSEIHSTIGTILFSYGAVGFLLFANTLRLFYTRGGVGVLLLLLPTFVYSFTHQGLRFRMFWVLLGFLYVGQAALSARRSAGPAATAKPRVRLLAQSAAAHGAPERAWRRVVSAARFGSAGL